VKKGEGALKILLETARKRTVPKELQGGSNTIFKYEGSARRLRKKRRRRLEGDERSRNGWSGKKKENVTHTRT